MNISSEVISNLKMQVQRTETDFVAKVLEKNDDVTKKQIRKEMWRLLAQQNNLTIIDNNEPQQKKYEINIKALAEKFLSWPLPNSVCSDLCVTDKNYPPNSRIGTNLLTQEEAEKMLRYLFDM